MNKLTTLAQIRAALAEKGATLIHHDSALSHDWAVQRFNGQRIPCTQVADRLTYGKNPAVKFSHRTPLLLTYKPIEAALKDEALERLMEQNATDDDATNERLEARIAAAIAQVYRPGMDIGDLCGAADRHL